MKSHVLLNIDRFIEIAVVRLITLIAYFIGLVL